MTPEDFQRLLELQHADSEIAKRRTIMAEVDDGSSMAEQIARDEEQLAELEEQLRQKQSRRRKLELDLEGIEEERQEKHDRAYGGTVSDPKELTALEQKIDELDRNAGRHEDMILELLEEIDQLEGRVKAQREKVEAGQAEYERTVQNYEETTGTARAEIDELTQRREELAEQLPPQLLSPYERLREREDGIAVAALIDGTCAECNMAIPRARTPMVERGASVGKCEHCRRILVMPSK
ncbi:MAG: zinc ribbon domain-containing protein [Armatimonadota bacterium]